MAFPEAGGPFFWVAFSGDINSAYGDIEIFSYATRRFLLLRAGGLPDDADLISGGRWLGAIKARYASSAAGTRRIHPGSIGGQFAVSWSKVPACLAAAIFSGTLQRET